MACLLELEGLLCTDTRSNGAAGALITAKHPDIVQIILFAKFTVLVQDGDWQAAEQCVRSIMGNGQYTQCLEVVDTFLEGMSGSASRVSLRDSRAKGVEMYRALMIKFPGYVEWRLSIKRSPVLVVSHNSYH